MRGRFRFGLWGWGGWRVLLGSIGGWRVTVLLQGRVSSDGAAEGRGHGLVDGSNDGGGVYCPTCQPIITNESQCGPRSVLGAGGCHLPIPPSSLWLFPPEPLSGLKGFILSTQSPTSPMKSRRSCRCRCMCWCGILSVVATSRSRDGRWMSSKGRKYHDVGLVLRGISSAAGGGWAWRRIDWNVRAAGVEGEENVGRLSTRGRVFRSGATVSRMATANAREKKKVIVGPGAKREEDAEKAVRADEGEACTQHRDGVCRRRRGPGGREKRMERADRRTQHGRLSTPSHVRARARTRSFTLASVP